jgi:hypothetical protein
MQMTPVRHRWQNCTFLTLCTVHETLPELHVFLLNLHTIKTVTLVVKHQQAVLVTIHPLAIPTATMAPHLYEQPDGWK